MTRYPTFSLQSFNYPAYFVRHRGFFGALTQIANDRDRSDATFSHLDGLRLPEVGDAVVFQSINCPGFYLRHEQFEIKLQERSLVGTLDADRPPCYVTLTGERFQGDSTFRVMTGLADRGWVSFESVNQAGRFIRHRGWRLYLDDVDDDLARHDATFRILDGLMPGSPRPEQW